jgi:Tol biopolymer transport system component
MSHAVSQRSLPETTSTPRLGRTFSSVIARRVAIATAAVVVAAASADGAQAAFRGDNGRLAFSWFHNTVYNVDEEDIATITSAGEDFRVIVGCEYGCNFGPSDWSPSGRRLAFTGYDDLDFLLATVRPGGGGYTTVYASCCRFPDSPAWSPLGGRIAFLGWSSRPDIYVIDRDGTNLVRLTRTRRGETAVDWSSRNRLVFSRRGDLFTMRPNGLDVRRLTDTTARESDPDWAPGGRWLTFVRDGAIWKMRASGAEAAMVVPSGSSPTWAPDGSVIAFIGDGGIRTVEPTGANDTVLSSPVAGFLSGLAWQPLPNS